MNANTQFCERESAVIEAVRRGVWEEDLRAHVAVCEACSEAALAAQALREMQAADVAAARVPAGGWMWWRMQLRAKREAGERATQPITLVEHVAIACSALSVLALFVWNWHAITAWFGGVSASSSAARFSIQAFLATFWESAGLLTLVSCGAFVVFLGLIAYFIWAEE